MELVDWIHVYFCVWSNRCFLFSFFSVTVESENFVFPCVYLCIFVLFNYSFRNVQDSLNGSVLEESLIIQVKNEVLWCECRSTKSQCWCLTSSFSLFSCIHYSYSICSFVYQNIDANFYFCFQQYGCH